jgi:hypothetical protein
MRIVRTRAVLLAFAFFVSSPLFSQSSNGTIGGSIADSSGAVIPGVTVTATNNATGVVSSVISNDAGVYNFASLLPGTYKVSAMLPGFQTQTFNDVQLGNAGQLRLNFALQVAAASQAVEVSVDAENLVTASSSSVGGVLAQKQIKDLPLVSNNVLDLVGTMGGTFLTQDKVFGAEQTSFAGVSARDINIQRDGISVNNQRWPNGLETPTKMNPDLVGEIRMILAPVDAEMGRGNGQIQILTRSGTNEYHGSATWNVQNSVFDANTWSNNARVPRIQPPWRNMHDYDVAFGGPIKKNKTFFYALWNQLIVHSRSEQFPTVLTDCARRGIFRYYDNFVNGNARQATTPVGAFTQTSTVNADGSPKSPDGSPLRYLSVFGPLAADPTKPDCSDAQINASTLVPIGAANSWDTNRKQLDKTGFIAASLDTMPRANAFDNPGNLIASGTVFVPDGLNTATHRWVRRNSGADNLFGAGGDTNNNRKQINFKIDHNFSVRHKVNASYSYEKDTSDDAALPRWPTGYYGKDFRQPQVLGVNFTSTLTSTLVNEARFGFSRTGANTVGAPERDDIGDEVSSKLLQVNGGPVYTQLGYQSMDFGYGIADGILYGSHEVSPRWVYGDSLSWLRGQHSFKFGGEYRLSSTKSTNYGTVQGGPTRPRALIGNAPLAQIVNIGRTGLAGTSTTGSQQVAENLLTFLSGSLGPSVLGTPAFGQSRFINEAAAVWNDFPNERAKIRDIAQNEFGFFFKDDWKATRDLTLNLGMRWDYFGVPWERNGLTTALTGGGYSLFGISGRSFNDWMKPGQRADLMEIIYVGPNSPNPDQRIYKRDMNNFGPAIGFAWNVPWGGANKTTVRGGYQIQYTGGGRGFVLDTAIGNPPGSSNTASYIIPSSDPYLNLEKVVANPSVVPVQPLFLPSPNTVIPVTDRTGLLNAFDPNFITPYIQNLTLSVTRNITSKVTLDLRYIGTLSRKLPSNMDLNAANFKYNGLKEAFDTARRGGESTLLNDMFAGLNIAGAGFGPVDGVSQTGAAQLRALLTGNARNNLANGSYPALAGTLSTLTINCQFNASVPACNQTDSQGRLLASLSGSVLRNSGKFPENFIRTNPQVATSVMETSLGHANYHSLQAQVSLRPSAGFSNELTYTWSRNLGFNPGEGANGTGSAFITDPTDRAGDYTLLSTHREHVVVDYGTFELPFGPGKLLLGNSSGIWARLAENWQASWIVNLSSGAPGNISAQNMLYGLGVPDIVGPFDIKDTNFGWTNGASTGNLFMDSNNKPRYTKVRDPQCSNTNILVSSLASLCTLQAVQNSDGQIVLQTPLPGNRGTFGQNRIENLGTWTTDAALQKRVRIAETKSFTLRVDATNVFNHPNPGLTQTGFFAPTPGSPDLNMQSTQFNTLGFYNNKIGRRTFQLKARLDF